MPAAKPYARTTAARRLFGRVRRRLMGRVHHLTLLPGSDLVREASAWCVTGENPTLRLHTDRASLPTSWVRLSYASSGHVGAEPLALLVESDGEREDVFHLPPAPATASLVLRLPPIVRSIRIRPPAGLERFDLHGLEIAELKRVESLRVLLGPYLEPLRRDPRMIGHFFLRCVSSTRRHGPGALWQTIVGRFPSAAQERYAEWVRRYDSLDAADRALTEDHIAALGHRPLFSLILPARGEDDLDDALRSVRAQWYEEWELLVVAFGERAHAVEAAVRRAADGDARIRFVATEVATRAAAANHALDAARGAFCAIVAPESELAPNALYLLAAEIDGHPQADLLYSDEDQLDARRRRRNPRFKPDWDPDLLLGCDFVGHLVVYRASLLRSLKGWRNEVDGCEDWDLALRAGAVVDAQRVRHVPHVLWHSHRQADARTNGLAAPTARRVLEEHLQRIGSAARLRQVGAGAWRLDHPLGPAPPLVSVLMPTQNRLALLRVSVGGLLQRTDYPALELLIIANRSDDPHMMAYLAALGSDSRVRVLRYDAPFNYSAINNLGASHAKGSFLALLNDDIEVITPDWLTEMVGQASRPGVGAVGAQLYYPDGKIQHAGIVLGLSNIAGHLFRGLPCAPGEWAAWAGLPRRVSAVTGACMVVRADLYRSVGGLDEDNLPVAFNDVDFCLRLGRRGYRTILTPHARLVHHESATRGLDHSTALVRRLRREEAFMRARWGSELEDDPAYNPNLTLTNASASVAFPPRASRPWLGRKRRWGAARSLAGATSASARR